VRRLLKVTAYSLMSVLAVLLIAAVAVYVRLSNGPVALDFMKETIESRINSNLAGMSMTIGGVLIERPGTGLPHFRLRNLELKDDNGSLIARAPRAAIGFDETAAFSGKFVPRSLELFGPRIRIMRNIEGQVELGFGEAAPEGESVAVDVMPQDPSGKTDQEAQDAGSVIENAGDLGTLVKVFSGDESGTEGVKSVGAIETIRISEAEIRFYDEANDSIWNIPKAELAFQRMPYGFAVAANAAVSNGPQEGEWHADMSASYRRESQSFAVSLRVNDLVPANISDEIFALSQLARVKVPMAGQIEMEITDKGLITKASAELSAAAGEVGLPDYLAEPIIVDEGSLRADYDPVTGSIIITDSSMLVGSSRAQVRGNVQPVRDVDGRLTALKISLQARNVAIDAQGSNRSPVAVDRIDFIGNALIDEARLDIDDLLVMSGNAGVRIRGTITGGGESAGIKLSGRVRDLSSALLKRLWPPVMAPKTRAWVNQNIQAGRIMDGEFQVNLPVDALARAQRNRRLPERSVNLSFRMAEVTTSYFKDLPPLTEASGEAKLIDNDFFLKVDSANVAVASGGKGRLVAGTMTARDILAAETMSEFDLDIGASAQTLIEYLSHPALNLIRNTGFDTTKLSGDTKLKVKLALPLIKDVPKDRVIVDAAAHISNATLKDALPDIDLTDGEVDLSVDAGAFKATGPVKIAGIPAKLSWQRAAGPAAKQSAVIEATLDGEQRRKIGIDLGTFLRGPIGLKATLADLGDPQGRVDIDADLDEADMRITAISWVRPATRKTNASFTYYSKGEGGRRVEDLVIKGPGLSIKGAIKLDPKGKGMREAKFTEMRLSDQNIFAMTVKSGEGGVSVSLKGDSFDARPLIRSMFSSRPQGDQPAEPNPEPISISLNLDRVYANRDELITGVSGSLRARGSRLEQAEISGTFLSGQPVVFRVTPVDGGREMRINGRDGGAAIRAANLYSRVAGGQIEFYALLSNDANSSVQKGRLILRNFEVRNEAALAELDARGRPKKNGPRKDIQSFTRLTLPFTSDAKFIRIGDSLVQGNELGASASGLIRKSDGVVDITGTIIPIYALNSFISNIPIAGDILTGGKGQGIIGVTFALGGNVDKPVFQMNPVSAVAPGILRKFFEYSNGTGQPLQSRNGNTDKAQN
jgi:hypothetical protein